jgi:hypothetical protein
MKKLLFSTLMFMGLMNAYEASAEVKKVDVKDEITTDTRWTTQQQYVLKGWVYVTNGATLTIDPGVIIRGDKNTKGTLIVERGAKIIAKGTAEKPIIFTSAEMQGNRNYGDWGGLMICGNAPTNWTAGEATVEGGPRSKYGGNDPHDNSGILSYVRIEFGGIAFSPNNEVNGLTLAGVGDGTQIDHVQVSYSGDDSYEWFGGTVNAKYLISLGAWDDDFDSDVQYEGKNQFCVVLRDPLAADVSGSKAIETDSYLAGTIDGKTDATRATKAVFSNCTFIGPVLNPAQPNHDPQYVAGVHIRRGSGLSLLNSIIGGWPCGLLIDESSSAYGSTSANIGTDMLQFRNNIIAGTTSNGTPANKDIIYVKDGARNLTSTNAFADTTTGFPFGSFGGPISWLKASANGNMTFASVQNGVRLQNAFNLQNPNFVPTTTSPVVYNSRALPGYMTTGGADPFKNGRVYPFDPTKPINTDTSNLFANYNAPTMLPDFTNSKASDAFFTKVNYVGAFAGTQTTADNWMAGWTRFDPLNENYELATDVSVEKIDAKVATATVFPNPASSKTSVRIKMEKAADVRVALVDVTGRMVSEIYNGKLDAGNQILPIDISYLQNGLYFVSIAAEGHQETMKLKVANK